jgi:hypothetical protein
MCLGTDLAAASQRPSVRDALAMEAGAAAAPASSKTVTFLRHGVAAHNFHDAQDPDPDEPTRYTDSPLTEYGRAQAAATATATPALACEMLVVAPLSRAIETGLLAFPEVGKVVAHEAVREYAARRYANKRKTRTELQEIFGERVDFGLISSDPDPLFNPEEAEPWPAGPVARSEPSPHKAAPSWFDAGCAVSHWLCYCLTPESLQCDATGRGNLWSG